MTDTVKIIIEIPKAKYAEIKKGVNHFSLMAYAIRKGIPLDSIKAKIDNEWANTHHMYPDYASGLACASEIIDRCIGKAESEEQKNDSKYTWNRL